MTKYSASEVTELKRRYRENPEDFRRELSHIKEADVGDLVGGIIDVGRKGLSAVNWAADTAFQEPTGPDDMGRKELRERLVNAEDEYKLNKFNRGLRTAAGISAGGLSLYALYKMLENARNAGEREPGATPERLDNLTSRVTKSSSLANWPYYLAGGIALPAGLVMTKKTIDKLFDKQKSVDDNKLEKLKAQYKSLLSGKQLDAGPQLEVEKQSAAQSDDPAVLFLDQRMRQATQQLQLPMAKQAADDDNTPNRGLLSDLGVTYGHSMGMLGLASLLASGVYTVKSLRKSDPDKIRNRAIRDAYNKFRSLRPPKMVATLSDPDNDDDLDSLDNSYANVVPITRRLKKESSTAHRYYDGRERLVRSMEETAAENGTSLRDFVEEWRGLSDADKQLVFLSSQFKRLKQEDHQKSSAGPVPVLEQKGMGAFLDSPLTRDRVVNAARQQHNISDDVSDDAILNELRQINAGEGSGEIFGTDASKIIDPIRNISKGGLNPGKAIEGAGDAISNAWNMASDYVTKGGPRERLLAGMNKALVEKAKEMEPAERKQLIAAIKQANETGDIDELGLTVSGLTDKVKNFVSNMQPAQWAGVAVGALPTLFGSSNWMKALGGVGMLLSAFGPEIHNYLDENFKWYSENVSPQVNEFFGEEQQEQAQPEDSAAEQQEQQEQSQPEDPAAKQQEQQEQAQQAQQQQGQPENPSAQQEQQYTPEQLAQFNEDMQAAYGKGRDFVSNAANAFFPNQPQQQNNQSETGTLAAQAARQARNSPRQPDTNNQAIIGVENGLPDYKTPQNPAGSELNTPPTPSVPGSSAAAVPGTLPSTPQKPKNRTTFS